MRGILTLTAWLVILTGMACDKPLWAIMLILTGAGLLASQHEDYQTLLKEVEK